jgi:hypothetical protein
VAKEQYIKRRDSVWGLNYISTYGRKWGIKLDKEHYYEHLPKSVERSQGNPSNKPDIIIRDKEKETCKLTGVAISGERIVIKKGDYEIYKDLTTEILHMWTVKTDVILRGNWNHLKIIQKIPKRHTRKT